MISHKKYLRALRNAKFSELRCTHCSAETRSPNGKKGICNFCEQTVGAEAPGLRVRGGFEEEFQRMHAESAKGLGRDDFTGLEKLLETNSNPEAFYVSALFYLFSSDLAYRSRNYALPGFMEENYANIQGSMDLTSKCKECFYAAAAGSAPSGAQSGEALYIKFLSEVKLNRLADASTTLGRLAATNGKDPLLDYASMAYGVRARTKDAEARLAKALKTEEPNAFYYLAEHLARNGRLAAASEVLVQLGQKADVRMSAHLLSTIREVQDASRM